MVGMGFKDALEQIFDKACIQMFCHTLSSISCMTSSSKRLWVRRCCGKASSDDRLTLELANSLRYFRPLPAHVEVIRVSNPKNEPSNFDQCCDRIHTCYEKALSVSYIGEWPRTLRRRFLTQ
jgi:hypothetical protein